MTDFSVLPLDHTTKKKGGFRIFVSLFSYLLYHNTSDTTFTMALNADASPATEQEEVKETPLIIPGEGKIEADTAEGMPFFRGSVQCNKRSRSDQAKRPPFFDIFYGLCNNK